MTHVRERPPLQLSHDIQTPSGKHYRWSEDEPRPENVPGDVRFSDVMPGGFETADCSLSRKPGTDYADLERLSTWTIYGAGGELVWQGRLERAPRMSGEQLAISPSAVGWQAHLEDDKSAAEVYIDQDLSHWTGPTIARRIFLINNSFSPYDAGVQPNPTTGIPGLLHEFQGGWTATTRPSAEALYDAGAGSVIGSVYFAYRDSANINHAGDANWDLVFALGDDAEMVVAESSADQAGVTPPSGVILTATTATRRYARSRLSYATGPVSVDGATYSISIRPVVYGNHGLPKRGLLDPQGFYGSDVVEHAVGAFAPMLNVTTESVQESSFVIPQLAFLEPTTAGEIVRQATRFGLQDWAVWDDLIFWWHDRGARGRKWRARVSPAQLEETGPQVDRLWESVIVSYQDVDGSTRTVGPPGSGVNTEDVSLKDSDPENPATKLGIVRRDLLQMGTSTAAGAIEIGRRFLEQAKLLDNSGRASLVGHVEDDRGVLHAYSKVRAGDQISFVDAADPSYRRIVKTDKDHGTRTCSVDLDAPPEGLAALLERLGVVLVPLGV